MVGHPRKGVTDGRVCSVVVGAGRRLNESWSGIGSAPGTALYHPCHARNASGQHAVKVNCSGNEVKDKIILRLTSGP